MRLKLHYAWWTHIPAAACIAINAGMLLNAQLSARVPVDFMERVRERWGAPRELWLSMLGLPLLILICSVLLDEYYARHEHVRHFAWASLVDELLIGLIVGMNVKMISQLSDPEPELSEWWPIAIVFAVVAVAIAVVLELRRPHLPSVDKVVDVAALAKDVQSRFQPGRRWVYWEKQDPLWWRCLIIAATVLLIAIAVGGIQKSARDTVLGAFFAVVCMFCYGGLNVVLTPGKFTVRAGIFGLPLLRLKLENVTKVEVVWFSALGDFGGWGLYRYSFSQRAWGLFLSGGKGIIVQTKKGRKFLIGSNTPEKLAAAIEAARKSGSPGPNYEQSGRSRIGRLFTRLILAAIGILVVLPLVALFLYAPGSPQYTITSNRLSIHDRFYPVTVKAADVDVEHVKVVNIRTDPHWRLTERTDGIGFLHYKAGLFRVAGGETVRMYRTTNQHLVLLPPKIKSTPVLIEVKHPEDFIQELRQSWR